MFILKELNAAECEGLASETRMVEGANHDLIAIITSYMARAGDRVCASMPGRPRSIKCNAVYKATLKSALRSDSTKRPLPINAGYDSEW